jgi:hypothetical protein
VEVGAEPREGGRGVERVSVREERTGSVSERERQADVEVGPGYPATPPRFALKLLKEGQRKVSIA